MPPSQRPAESVPGRDRWTEARAEGRLRSLELFGMRFGLDRMRRMMTVLGSPERAFETIQVLGTNGKSSTTRMTAAILQRHGLRTGAYLSPHLTPLPRTDPDRRAELGPEAFSAAVARADRAAEQVNRTLSEDDHVTQFELLTAAALWQMAQEGVQVAAIEAGLGGRYDATSVVQAQGDRADERRPRAHPLARPDRSPTSPRRSWPSCGPGRRSCWARSSSPRRWPWRERIAAEREARIVRPRPIGPEVRLRSRGAFQRRNLALARTAAEAYLQSVGRELDARAVLDAAAATEIPGRLQRIGEDPPTVLDGAHNPDAVAALIESLPDALEQGPLALVLGVLEDKDAAGMLRLLLPLSSRAWFTAPPSERALSPAALAVAGKPDGLPRQRLRAAARARAGRGPRLGDRQRRGRCSPRARSIWSAICWQRSGAPLVFATRTAPPAPPNDERSRPIRAHDDRGGGADRRARHPRLLRRWLRFRPPVSLNSTGRCPRSRTSESKAAV